MPTDQQEIPLRDEGPIEDQDRRLAETKAELAAANEELRVQRGQLLAQQEQLRQQNEVLEGERRRYQELFDLAPDGYLVTDLWGVIREANQAASALLSLPEASLAGTPLAAYCAPAGQGALSTHLQQLREGEADEVRNWETSLAPSEGVPVEVLISMTPVRSPAGEVTGLRWLVRDITQRVQWEEERERLLAEQARAEKALRVSMEKYQVLFESFPLGITVADERGNIVEANLESERLLGVSIGEQRQREVDGREWQIVRLDGSPMSPGEYASVRALRERRLVEDVEMGIVKEDGSTTWISVTAAPIPLEGYGVAAAYGDITARVHSEQQLRRYAERLRLQRETDHAILSSRSAGEMVEAVLRQLPRLLPCRRAGVNLLDPEAQEVWLLATYSAGETSLAKGWRAPVAESLGQSMENLARGEGFVVDDMQALAPWSPLAAQLQAEGVRAEVLQPLIVQGELIGALGIGMDVPGPLPAEQMETVRELADALAVGIQQMRLYEEVQRYAAELEQRVDERTAELAASEARYRAIFEQAAMGIALVDEGGRLLSANPALQHMLGYSAEELEGVPLAALAEGPHPASPEGGGERGAPLQRPAATVDTGRLSSPPTVDPGALGPGTKGDALQGRGIEAGQPTRPCSGPYRRVERRYRRKDGGTIDANETLSPVRVGGDGRRFTVALIEDVTEHKRAQEALLRSEGLALTGRLAASVAHEIGNPLQVVLGSLALAEEIEAEGGDGGRYRRMAMDELERAARLVHRLRELSQPSGEEKLPVCVDELVDKVLALSRKQCQNQGVEVVWEAGGDVPAIAAVPDRVQQVLLNLTLNAVDAMPGGGRLHIRTAPTGDPPGVEITFADTGSGIPPEQLDHLFEAFASSKQGGLGLGLYVSRNIVHEHGGRIEVESEVGSGTTFTIWLPVEG